MNPDRRAFLVAAGAAGLVAIAPLRARGAPEAVRLVAATARVPLVGGAYPETAMWAYNGTVPGPELRFRQGERARIEVENRLPEPTTVHWHGLRVPNAMDGVPGVTQPPIAPGERFVYEFDLPDAGTFWYHPHANSPGQVGRGLAGAFIVEETAPVAADRDVTWVLSDFRLNADAAVVEDFGNPFDASHAGRIGNTVTLNGRVPDAFAVRAGERIRLRLVNAGNARVFALAFEGHAPWVVALDGHPVDPHPPEDGRVVLGPGMRADLVLDMTGTPAGRYGVFDGFYRNRTYRLVDLAYGADAARAAARQDPPARLPDNPVPEPDLARAQRHVIELGGGMMDPRMMRAMREGGGMAAMSAMRERMQRGHVWSLNGVSVAGHAHAPLLTLKRGSSHVIEIVNDTAWHHPMHLHGMTFRIIARNGQPPRRRVLADTALLDPGERVAIAFVAEPGTWMFHCHILEHQESGMMGAIEVG